MLLAVDIGNTNTVTGLFDRGRLCGKWRMRSQRGMTCDEIHLFCSNVFSGSGFAYKDVTGVIISCVVPSIGVSFEEFCRKYLCRSFLRVDETSALNMQLLVDNPHSIGADRIVNAVAAFSKYRSSLIVIDFGTATTFDVISKDGAYLGGSISPGIRIAAEALYRRTSQLPEIREFRLPNRAIAKNTPDAMNAGIIYGYAGLVDGIVRRTAREMETSPKVIATGGFASLISGVAETIDSVEADLTLEGLWIIHEKRENNKAASA